MSRDRTRRFLLVGLTGGIATGKSTVADTLQRLGAVVIDADALAREVVEPGQPALAEIVREFGQGVLGSDGRLDRKRLGAIVFRDPERRRRLEAITHPAIRAQLNARLQELEARGFDGVVVFDAPVMIETGGHTLMDRLVVVVTDEATQRARLMARDGLDEAAARQRMASQLPLAEKAKLADYVVDNSGDRAATQARVRRVFDALRSEKRVSADLLGQSGVCGPLGVVFPMNLGNRGHNEFAPASIMARLKIAGGPRFLGYHWRRSGNFVFIDDDEETRATAVKVLKDACGLDAVARSFPCLYQINWHLPDDTVRTVRGSVLVRDRSGTWRVIAVFLHDDVPAHERAERRLARSIKILGWPSARDVVCAYDRPGEAGDVGSVTRAVVRAVGCHAGSGRGLGVLREILGGKGVRR